MNETTKNKTTEQTTPRKRTYPQQDRLVTTMIEIRNNQGKLNAKIERIALALEAMIDMVKQEVAHESEADDSGSDDREAHRTINRYDCNDPKNK